MRISITTLLAAGAALALAAPDSSAQCLSDRFWSSNGTSGDIFGRSIGLSGDTMIVGASRTDRGGMNSVGSVYRFERTPSGFVEMEEWNAFDGAQQAEFGEDCAIDGDWAVVGARWADVNGTNSGAAYVYQNIGGVWTPGPKLSGSQTDDNDNFGTSVGIADGPTPRIAIGANWHGDIGTGFSTGGAVYIYEYDAGTTSWVESQILRGHDTTVGDYFGVTLDFDGDRLIVGATSHHSFGSGAGAVYVFGHDGTQFVESAQLIGSDTMNFENFGKKVSLDGDQLAVISTKTYVFQYDGANWNEEAILVPASVSSSYGDSVDLQDDRLVATEYNFGSNGEAWYFERVGGTWTESGNTTQFTVGDYYGRVALLDGDSFYVTADAANQNGTGLTSGEVYTYRIDGPDCNANGIPDACDIYSGASVDGDADGVPDECGGGPSNYCSSSPNSTGAAAVIGVSGSLSVSTNDFTLEVSPVPDQPGLFFYGANQTDMPFGNGRLCVNGTIVRLPVIYTGLGSIQFPIDNTNLPANGPITSGSTWNFQNWYRDVPAGAPYFNLSNGYSIVFVP